MPPTASSSTRTSLTPLILVFVVTLLLSTIFWNAPTAGNSSGSNVNSNQQQGQHHHHQGDLFGQAHQRQAEEQHSVLMRSINELREQLAGIREEMKAGAGAGGGGAAPCNSGKPSSTAQGVEHHQDETNHHAEKDGGNNNHENSDDEAAAGKTMEKRRSSLSSLSGGTKMPYIKGKKLAHGQCKGPLTVPKMRVPLPGNKCPRAEKPPKINEVLEHDPDPEHQGASAVKKKDDDGDAQATEAGENPSPSPEPVEEVEKGASQNPDQPKPSSAATHKPISFEWLKKAEEVFGEKDVVLTPVQWEVFKVVFPISVNTVINGSSGEGTQQAGGGEDDQQQRFDFTVDWPSIIETPPSKGNRNVGLNTGMGNLVKKLKASNPANDKDVGNLCAFSRGRGLYRYYEGRMAQDAYSFIKFLYNHMWKKKGWIAMPTAGTALGVLRHHGMYDHDDDLDLFVYPPLKYLLPPTLEERQKWEKQHEDYLSNLATRTTQVPTPVPTDETKHDKMMRIMKEEGAVDLLVRNYSWPLTAMDTWRRVYDDFHEAFLEYRREVHNGLSGGEGKAKTRPATSDDDSTVIDDDNSAGPYSFQWEEGFITYFHRESHTMLHKGVRFEDYFLVEGKDMRSCALRYDSTNLTDTRKPFWKKGKCEPMHVNICLQAPQFLYERAAGAKGGGGGTKFGGPASLFTLGAQHAAGTLCKCRFGPENSKEHFMMCPPDLLSFIGAWYGKEWCIQAGPANTGSYARKFKSWND